MNPRLTRFLARGGAAVAILLAIEVAVVSLLRYFTGGAQPPQVILDNAFARPWLAIHVGAGVVSLLAGIAQLSRRLRRRAPRVHRAVGLAYVAACLLSAPSAIMLSLGTEAGPIAGTGFALSAVLLAGFTFLGVRAALRRRFALHREWMLRSYAITGNAVTLRVMLPLAGLLGYSFLAAYAVIAWVSWLFNLALVELYIRRARTGASAIMSPAPT
jgi:hypothetical protein